jgi:hypothetical protein
VVQALLDELPVQHGLLLLLLLVLLVLLVLLRAVLPAPAAVCGSAPVTVQLVRVRRARGGACCGGGMLTACCC